MVKTDFASAFRMFLKDPTVTGFGKTATSPSHRRTPPLVGLTADASSAEANFSGEWLPAGDAEQFPVTGGECQFQRTT